MAILREHIAARGKRLAELVDKQTQDGAFYLEDSALIWDITNPIKEKLLIMPYLPIQEGIVIKRRKLNDERWQEVEQDAGLPLLTWAQTCPILAEVVRFLPEDAKKMALLVRYLQISMLNTCLQSDAFKQLCESDFNLAWLFLGCAQKAQLTEKDIEHWLTRPRLDLLELVAGHRQKWMLKWLRKVTASIGDVHEWERLQKWIRDPQQVAYLNGFEAVSVSFLQIMTLLDLPIDIRKWRDDLETLKPLSGKDVRSWLWQVRETAEDVQRMGKALGIPAYSHFDNVHSFAGLKRRHDKWMKRLLLLLPEEEGLRGVFPMPPFEGTETIQPILTFMSLCKEGQRMRHCVSSYRENIEQGESYIYRFLGAQRATVELICSKGGWSLGQIKGHHNTEPTAETLSDIQAWFDQYEGSKVSYLERRRSLSARPNDVFFPLPPFVTESPLIALESEQMYEREQRYMNGQIQSTVEQIHKGERYVFRVERPEAERVIEFECAANGQWQVVNVACREVARNQNDVDLLDWWLAMSDIPEGWSVLEVGDDQ
ncbi:PcfJ domain-containing protein [Marinomonas algicola]|uniref:PcfJ domain-containing protein n=1 Tax=Marinomonas algicola TaxID=2773454 RepID=UPI00174D6434|nr:PcfJ domain-containing protein [Marinomonas algicola]